MLVMETCPRLPLCTAREYIAGGVALWVCAAHAGNILSMHQQDQLQSQSHLFCKSIDLVSYKGSCSERKSSAALSVAQEAALPEVLAWARQGLTEARLAGAASGLLAQPRWDFVAVAGHSRGGDVAYHQLQLFPWVKYAVLIDPVKQPKRQIQATDKPYAVIGAVNAGFIFTVERQSKVLSIPGMEECSMQWLLWHQYLCRHTFNKRAVSLQLEKAAACAVLQSLAQEILCSQQAKRTRLCFQRLGMRNSGMRLAAGRVCLISSVAPAA